MTTGKRAKVCFVAQFPPPINGLTKAVDTLYTFLTEDKYIKEKIDITNNKRIIQIWISIRKSCADIFYFTLSQSRGGNLRDLFLLSTIINKKKKCIVHLHGGYYRKLLEEDVPKWQAELNTRILSKVDAAIVLGPSLKKIFEGIVPEERIYVVPNCVDDNYVLSNDEFFEKIVENEKSDIRHVLCLSNLIRDKGYVYVLQMAQAENERIKLGVEKKYHFDFAGAFPNADEENFFVRYIHENELESIVTYHGVVDGNEKRNLLNKSSYFVLLTTYPKEGQPISIIEAAANGLIVLTTDHAGIPDLISDLSECHVEPKDNIDAKACLSYLDELKSEQIADGAKSNRTQFLTKYTQTNFVGNLDSIFSKVFVGEESDYSEY